MGGHRHHLLACVEVVYDCWLPTQGFPLYLVQNHLYQIGFGSNHYSVLSI